MGERLEEETSALPAGRWRRDGAVAEVAAHGRHPVLVTLAAAAAAYGTLLVITVVGDAWIAANLTASIVAFALIVALILVCAMRVMHHGEALAEMLGEPMGALVLTLSAAMIEVSLLAVVMLSGEANPTIVRDTVHAELMIILGMLLGLALLLGGIRHRQQVYNLEGARSFLAILVPVPIVVLILPDFALTEGEATLSRAKGLLIGALTLAIYVTFLVMQTVRHKAHFADPEEAEVASATLADTRRAWNAREAARSGGLLLLVLLPIPLLADHLDSVLEVGIHELGMPHAVAGVVIAALVLSPEGAAAIQAAHANRLQRAVNLMLGSALSSIALAVPIMIAISAGTGMEMILGLDEPDAVLLATLLLLTMITFGGTRTDMLKGAVHLAVFAVFLVLVLF
jgi:Ca2+:H+ antiporter